jgi:hypothetical protein
MDPEHRHVGADDRLTHEGQEHRRVVADVRLSGGGALWGDDFGYTLQYVIFSLASFSGWVSRCAHDSGSSITSYEAT